MANGVLVAASLSDDPGYARLPRTNGRGGGGGGSSLAPLPIEESLDAIEKSVDTAVLVPFRIIVDVTEETERHLETKPQESQDLRTARDNLVNASINPYVRALAERLLQDPELGITPATVARYRGLADRIKGNNLHARGLPELSIEEAPLAFNENKISSRTKAIIPKHTAFIACLCHLGAGIERDHLSRLYAVSTDAAERYEMHFDHAYADLLPGYKQFIKQKGTRRYYNTENFRRRIANKLPLQALRALSIILRENYLQRAYDESMATYYRVLEEKVQVQNAAVRAMETELIYNGGGARLAHGYTSLRAIFGGSSVTANSNIHDPNNPRRAE